MRAAADTLILAWGNPGRGDDGLGPAFIDDLKELALQGVEFESGYQLQVEDAELISRYQRVVFVDADRGAMENYWLEPIRSIRRGLSFTTHHVAPDSLLALSRDLFQKEPDAWLLGIRGYEFDEFGEGLTEQARANLREAVAFLDLVIRDSNWQTIRGQSDSNRSAREQEGEPCQTSNR